jgi:hypothetical protein
MQGVRFLGKSCPSTEIRKALRKPVLRINVPGERRQLTFMRPNERAVTNGEAQGNRRRSRSRVANAVASPRRVLVPFLRGEGGGVRWVTPVPGQSCSAAGNGIASSVAARERNARAGLRWRNAREPAVAGLRWLLAVPRLPCPNTLGLIDRLNNAWRASRRQGPLPPRGWLTEIWITTIALQHYSDNQPLTTIVSIQGA